MVQKKGRIQLKDLAAIETSPTDRGKTEMEIEETFAEFHTPGSCTDIAGDWAAAHARQQTRRYRDGKCTQLDLEPLNDVSGDRGKTCKEYTRRFVFTGKPANTLTPLAHKS